MNEEERAAVWKEWLEERPPAVRAVAESHPFGCYRLSDDGGHGHYQIVAYTEPHDGSAVKIKRYMAGTRSRQMSSCLAFRQKSSSRAAVADARRLRTNNWSS